MGPRDLVWRLRLPHNAIRVLATHSLSRRRKDQFRQEFLLALKMLESGMFDDRHALVWLARWADAILADRVLQQCRRFDGDGRRDIWTSIHDALASAAKQLVDKGWQRGRTLAYEVRAPAMSIARG